VFWFVVAPFPAAPALSKVLWHRAVDVWLQIRTTKMHIKTLVSGVGVKVSY